MTRCSILEFHLNLCIPICVFDWLSNWSKRIQYRVNAEISIANECSTKRNALKISVRHVLDANFVINDWILLQDCGQTNMENHLLFKSSETHTTQTELFWLQNNKGQVAWLITGDICNGEQRSEKKKQIFVIVPIIICVCDGNYVRLFVIWCMPMLTNRL